MSGWLSLLEEVFSLRERAFIEVLTAPEDMYFVGTLGRVPWEILYAFDCVSVPVRAADLDVLSFCPEDREGCDMIRATRCYRKKDKCPFIHRLNLLVCDTVCPVRERLISPLFESFCTFDVKYAELFIEQLRGFTSLPWDKEKFAYSVELSKKISSYILKFRRSSLSAMILYAIEYQTRFILDPEKRLDFLVQLWDTYCREHPHDDIKCPKKPLYCQCGIYFYKKYDATFSHYLTEGYFCEGEKHDLFHHLQMKFIEEKYGIREQGIPDLIIEHCPYYKG